MRLRNRFREFAPIVLLFIVLNGFFIAGSASLQKWNVDQSLVIAGNLLLFAITFVSFLVAERGLQKENPNAFVRSIYTSMMVKLFIALFAALIYIAINRKGLNKPGLFTLMGLYLVYTFLEVRVLTRLLKK